MKKYTFLLILFGLYINVFATIDTLNVDIVNDTTLTTDTIYVSQGITISQGATLTIEPGVVLIFKGDASNFNANQNSDAAYLLVKGQLSAQGEANNRIIFTAADTNEKWGGLFFENNAPNALLKYCDISYANKMDSLENVNYTGAISFENDSNNVFACNINNTITAIYAHNSKVTIYNTILNNNITAIKADTASYYVYNNTITDNANGIYLSDESEANIINSIIYNNSTNQLYGTGTFTVEYTDVEGGYTGTGNVDLNPELNTQYKLNPCSPVINIGSPETDYLLENTDYFGNDRVFWTLVDLGAYEHQYVHSYVGSDTSRYYICGGDSVLVDGIWYKNDTTFINTFNNAVNYCDSTIVIDIKEAAVPTLTFELEYPEKTTVCLGDRMWVTAVISPADENATYTWSSTDTTESLIIMNENKCKNKYDAYDKQYYCEISSNGCVVKDTVDINVYPAYNFNLGNDTTVCRGYQLTVDQGMTSYEWSTGSTENEIDIVETGNYSVTIYDQNNCRNESPVVEITVLPSPVVEFLDDTIKIYEDGFTILGGASGYIDNYLWNTGETTPTINVDAANLSVGAHTYWLRCDYNNGCEASDTVIVVVMEGVGVNEIETTNGINIYPNPAINNLNISADFTKTANLTITITNLAGVTVSKQELGQVSQINKTIDISNLEKGLYFLNINFDNKNTSYKINIK